MNRPRKAELDAVAALLLEPADDVEQLAASVIAALDAVRAGQRRFALLVRSTDGDAEVWGPYATAKQAVKGAQEALIGKADAVYAVLPLMHPGQPVPANVRPPSCANCAHPAFAHGFLAEFRKKKRSIPGLVVRDCGVRNCECKEMVA